MGNYLKATILVLGGVIGTGFILMFAPVVLVVLSVCWPLLIIPLLIVVVADYLKRRR